MITLEQFKECSITISKVLEGNAALEYIAKNTTLTIDLNDVETVNALPFSAKLFVEKYEEVSSASSTVSSESIEGLSQSFNSADKDGILWGIAESLLGKWLKSPVKFVVATGRWDYVS